MNDSTNAFNPVDVTPEALGNRDDVAKIRDFLQAKRERELRERDKRRSERLSWAYKPDDLGDA